LFVLFSCRTTPTAVDLQYVGQLTPEHGRLVSCDTESLVVVHIQTLEQAKRHVRCAIPTDEIDWTRQGVLAAYATTEALRTTLGHEGLRIVDMVPDPEEPRGVTVVVTAYGNNGRICDTRVVDERTHVVACIGQ
jgi:hypothetical protein